MGTLRTVGCDLCCGGSSSSSEDETIPGCTCQPPAPYQITFPGTPPSGPYVLYWDSGCDWNFFGGFPSNVCCPPWVPCSMSVKKHVLSYKDVYGDPAPSTSSSTDSSSSLSSSSLSSVSSRSSRSSASSLGHSSSSASSLSSLSSASSSSPSSDSSDSSDSSSSESSSTPSSQSALSSGLSGLSENTSSQSWADDLDVHVGVTTNISCNPDGTWSITLVVNWNGNSWHGVYWVFQCNYYYNISGITGSVIGTHDLTLQGSDGFNCQGRCQGPDTITITVEAQPCNSCSSSSSNSSSSPSSLSSSSRSSRSSHSGTSSKSSRSSHSLSSRSSKSSHSSSTLSSASSSTESSSVSQSSRST